MQSIWWRRALQQRFGALAGAALILWTMGTAAAASVATRRIEASLVAEREVRARGIASRVERALEDDLRQLDLIAAASVLKTSGDAVAAHCRGVRLAESVLRVAADGRVLWMRSVVDGRERPPTVTILEPPPDGRWHVRPTDVIGSGAGARAFLVLPARESDPVGGAVAAVISPETTALRALIGSYAAEPYRVELIDGRGRQMAGSRPAAPGDTGEQPAESVSGTQLRRAPDVELVAATAPIASGPWGIRLVQSRAEALAPVFTLRRTLLWSSILALGFAVLAAWGTGRSIRQPVLAMTDAAERLARGERGQPILATGEDEIARLARALEQLRLALEGDERRSRLLKHVITAQEDERRRIARELHDQTTQQLTALALRLNSAGAALPAAREGLVSASDLVRTMIDDVHRIIYDLRPSMLDDLGLLPAIRWYADIHLGRKGVAVHCEFPETIPGLSADASTALYRVAQEALTNISRHAGAETVLIACTVGHGRVTLEIEDDGRGFDPEPTTRPRETGEGLGLLGMRERIALLGGTWRIESTPGAGTRVIAVLPLDEGNGAAT
jgi:signal transduction histidine kinase